MDQEIKDILNLFESGQRKIILKGMAGIGKTELSRYLFFFLIEQNFFLFDYVGWIDYSLNIRNSCYKKFNFLDKKYNISDYLSFALQFLNDNSDKTLLFIDNITDFKKEDLAILLKLNCYIIMTSRSHFDQFKSIIISGLNISNCIRLYKSHSNDYICSRQIIEKIIELCNYHTLSIELLAKTQLSSGLSACQLLKKLELSKFSLKGIEETVSYYHGSGENLNQKMIEHLSIIFNINPLLETEKQLLTHVSILPSNYFFTSENIKIFFDLLDLNVINQLVDKGWIIRQINEQGVTGFIIHPVVKSVVEFNYYADFKNMKYAVLNILIYYFYGKLIDNDIINIFKSVVNYYIRLLDDIFLFLLNTYCEILAKRYDFKALKEVCLLSLSIVEEKYYGDAVLIIFQKRNVSYCFYQLGNNDAAMSYITDVIETYKSSGFNITYFLMDCIHIKAIINANQGNIEKAISLHYVEMQLLKNINMIDTLEWASACNCLGILYGDIKKIGLSYSYLLIAKNIRERILGKNNVITTETYVNLGNLFTKCGNYDAAKKMYIYDLKVCKTHYPNNSEPLAVIYNNLAEVFSQKQNKLITAEFFAKRALLIYKKSMLYNHIFIAFVYNTLGGIYTKQKMYNEALKNLNSALKIFKDENNFHPIRLDTENKIDELTHLINKYK